MSDLEEFRYPFHSGYEFLRYAGDPAASHLWLAWTLILLLALRLCFEHGIGASKKLLALYFGLTMFNNPAFQLIPGFSLGDLCGIACFVYAVMRLVLEPSRRFPLSPVGVAVCVAGALMSLHAVCIGLFYPSLNIASGYEDVDGSVALLRAVVLGKVLIFGVCSLLFHATFKRAADLEWLLRQVVNFAMVGLLVYVLQACMLLGGLIPYGLFLDAGYLGFPAFGSVSIERGHFGKFMTPLFPVFLLAVLRRRRAKSMALFGLVTLANFSASSLSFFAFYAVSTLYAFKRKFLRVKVAAWLGLAGCALATFVAYTSNLWMAVIQKITVLAVQGDDEGGRGLSLFLTYLAKYPLGTSYSGSRLRTAPGLVEINSGLFAFVTQESVLAPVLMLGFLALLIFGWSTAGRISDKDTRRTVKIGILAMPFIFATDILWFVPTVWLPLLLAFSMPQLEAPAAEAFQPANALPLLSLTD